MVLWNPTFTKANPQFRLSTKPGETKENMVRLFLGAEISPESEQDDVTFCVHPVYGPVYISSWEIFLNVATKEQVKVVKDCLHQFKPMNARG